ncbi:hypothetical protein, partial [Neisseria elongata]|uniref:hypothetical protein n=1 Tax=Neisseria elongata TaxID=495 RepID=UPI000667E598
VKSGGIGGGKQPKTCVWVSAVGEKKFCKGLDLFAVPQNNLSGGCDKNMVKAVVAAVFAAGNDPPAHFFCPSVNHLLGQLSVFIQTLFDLIHRFLL